MTLAPRVVLVRRRSEYEELLARHSTRGQAAFFLGTRGRDIAEVESAHQDTASAIRAVTNAIPVTWRTGTVERADLPRFLFEPDDIIVVVGQDGLVANAAKYLSDQLVIGIDPRPGRNPGILVNHSVPDCHDLVIAAARHHIAADARTMVTIRTDDGQELTALNEIYLGHASHQTSWYTISTGTHRERQASSGLIVATGTGTTGWCRSIAEQRHSTLTLPSPTDPRLAWFVREAWPSPSTGTTLTEGLLDNTSLEITVATDRLVAFGDGIEQDHLALTWGQQVQIQRAARALRLVA